MTGPNRKTCRETLKFFLFVMVLAGIFVVFLLSFPPLDIPKPLAAAPEPGTLLLFGSGIIALGFAWKSRR